MTHTHNDLRNVTLHPMAVAYTTWQKMAMPVAVAVAGLICNACVSTHIESAQVRAKPPVVGRIAVASLANLSETANANQVISELLVTELTKRRYFPVVDATRTGEVTYRGPVERSRAQDLGVHLNVDGVLYGTVLEYGYFRGAPHYKGNIPTMSVIVRLVSSKNGALLWAAALTSSQLQILSYDNMPIEGLAQTVVTALVDDIIQNVRAATTVPMSMPKVSHAEPQGEVP